MVCDVRKYFDLQQFFTGVLWTRSKPKPGRQLLSPVVDESVSYVLMSDNALFNIKTYDKTLISVLIPQELSWIVECALGMMVKKLCVLENAVLVHPKPFVCY